MSEKIPRPILCQICGEEITSLPRDIPPEEREYKADMVISRDAYWNDAGIFTIIRTRQMFHKKCFEDAIDWYGAELRYNQQMG